jgi:ribosomal protein L44E
VYKGISRFCPYCGHDNGKTQKEIEQDKEAELVAIKKVEKRKQGMAQSIDELVAIGRKRGYKNPYYWAKQVMLGRRRSV